MMVGRDETADIHVDEPLVSRLHARIERRGHDYVVLDLGSTNHTRVNGETIHERVLATATRCASRARAAGSWWTRSTRWPAASETAGPRVRDR